MKVFRVNKSMTKNKVSLQIDVERCYLMRFTESVPVLIAVLSIMFYNNQCLFNLLYDKAQKGRFGTHCILRMRFLARFAHSVEFPIPASLQIQNIQY